MSLRLQRVQALLKREIGEAIRCEIPLTEGGLLNVNDVIVTGDLRSAVVYVGILGTAKQKQTGLTLLQKHRRRIQSLVGHAVVLKYTPQLKFVVDDAIERGNRVLQILDELDNPSSDA